MPTGEHSRQQSAMSPADSVPSWPVLTSLKLASLGRGVSFLDQQCRPALRVEIQSDSGSRRPAADQSKRVLANYCTCFCSSVACVYPQCKQVIPLTAQVQHVEVTAAELGGQKETELFIDTASGDLVKWAHLSTVFPAPPGEAANLTTEGLCVCQVVCVAGCR